MWCLVRRKREWGSKRDETRTRTKEGGERQEQERTRRYVIASADGRCCCLCCCADTSIWHAICASLPPFHPQMSLILSPSFTSSQKPINSTVLPQNAYVLSLASISSFYAAASSAPTNAIYIFDKSELRRVVQTLPGHDVAITALRSVNVNNEEMLLSSGKDGVVRTWDVRASKVAVESE